VNLVPSERIDKNTGFTYEEPFKPSTLLSEALKTRKAKRDGGLMVSIGVTPVSEKQISKLTKSLKKRKAKRDGGLFKKIMQDKDYDRWLDKLGGLDKDKLTENANTWAAEKQKSYPTFDEKDIANTYLHAISTYELSTDNPLGGEGDKGFQKVWRSKARQKGMQVKEMRQAAEAMLGEKKDTDKFVEALKDRRNNVTGINAYIKHGQNKEKAYTYIDDRITKQLDSVLSGKGLSAVGPVINPNEEMYWSKWLK